MTERRLKDDIMAQQMKKPGLRGRINAMCVSCTYDHLDKGNWRQQVGACDIIACALHAVRPYSNVRIV